MQQDTPWCLQVGDRINAGVRSRPDTARYWPSRLKSTWLVMSNFTVFTAFVVFS
jgi:hypothetical protein